MNSVIKKIKNSCGIKIIFIAIMLIFFINSNAYASVINVDVNGTKSDTLEIVILLTILTLLPSIIIMMTSFTRIVIVLSFLRTH